MYERVSTLSFSFSVNSFTESLHVVCNWFSLSSMSIHSKLEVSLGLIEIASASTTIQMIQDICIGSICRVVSWKALDNFPHFFGFLLCFPTQKDNISPIHHFAYILHVVAVWCCNISRQLHLHEYEAEHEHEAALLSALVVCCERVDQLTMFN